MARSSKAKPKARQRERLLGRNGREALDELLRAYPHLSRAEAVEQLLEAGG